MKPATIAILTLALAACASGGAEPRSPGWPGGAGPEPDLPSEYRGVPGFDTRDYPGDDAMRAWRDSSPYRWVGFYLPAPCYTGTSWNGRADDLRRMGWGVAVLFVGEQDWAQREPAAEPADPASPRCTRSNLTAERGHADARAAANAAAAEGFATGTVVYLDVERVEAVSDSLARYVGAWAAGLLDDGRYTPGLYAHASNADALRERMTASYRAAGRSGAPPLWVASTGGFSLRRAPSESGYPARIWQGSLDVTETWGDVRLRIDANVAESADPSAPPGP